MSREGTVRSPSAMSNASNSAVQVRLRSGHHRKPRPTSIAVSGMSQSMYEKKPTSAASTPSSFRGPPRCEIGTNTYFNTKIGFCNIWDCIIDHINTLLERNFEANTNELFTF